MRLIALVLAVLFLAVAPAIAERPAAAPATRPDVIDNPTYAAWARFGAGTTVTHKFVNNIGGKTTEGTTVATIESVDEKQVVVSTVRKVGAAEEGKPTRQVIAARVLKPATLPTEVARQQLKIGTRDFECKVMDFAAEIQGRKIFVKAFMSDQVPGGIVKSVTSLGGPNTIETFLQAFEIKPR